MFLNKKGMTARALCWMMLAAATASIAQEKSPASAPPAAPAASQEGGAAKSAPEKKKSDPGDAKDGAPAGGERRKGKGGGDGPEKPEKTAYDYELPGADGKGVPMSGFKGRTLVVVNLGRKSSYDSQLAGLEKLSETYKDKDVVVIGVPSDEFGAAEPGTDAEIQKFYKVDSKITFPVMAKATLTGDAALPFFSFLTGKGAPEGGPVHWNYTKFIIDKSGKVIARFDSDVAPDSDELMSILDQVLDGTYKPKKAGGPGGPGGDPGDGPLD